jgi:sugar lactone lactonase YvrE
MDTFHGRSAPLAVVTLALAAFLAACSGGGGDAGSGETPPAAEQPGVLRTIADWAGAPDAGGPPSRDGTGSAARFTQPRGVAVAGDGSLWVSEPLNQRIRRIHATGSVTTVFDASTFEPRTMAGRILTFSKPGALVAAPTGEVFVALEHISRSVSDPDNTRLGWSVLRIEAGAPSTLVAHSPPGTGGIVTGLGLDRQGRLTIGDLNCAIWRTDGEVLRTFQPRGAVLVHASHPASPGGPCRPLDGSGHEVTRLTMDADERVLFTLARGDIQRVEPDGRISTIGQTWPVGGTTCGGMAVDRSGRLLLGGLPALMQLDAAGQEQPVAGSPQQRGWLDGPAASARFGKVCGVAVDHEGRIVVADGGNHTVRRIAGDGSVSTVAGLAPQWGHRDGAGVHALFGGPVTVGPGLDGDVVVADPENAVVRRVDARRNVSTVAGEPTEPATFPAIPGSDGPVATARLVRPSDVLMTADGSLWIGEGTTLRQLGTDAMVRTLANGAGSPNHWVLAMALDRAGDVVVAWGGTTIGQVESTPYQHFERYSAKAPRGAPQRLEAIVPADLSRRLGGKPINALCVLPDGSFAYTQRHAVLHRAADGTVSVLAGSPDVAGDNDGPGATAHFNDPDGLACDAAGGIYVADGRNHTVRYDDAQRRVRTVLGTPGLAGHRVDAVPGQLHSPYSLALVPGGLIVSTGLGLVRAGF